MVRKRWGANLFTWNWRLSAVDPIHACSKTMQNSEPAYVHCPHCRPADLDPVPTFFEDLVTLWVWESKFFWWKMRLLIETQKIWNQTISTHPGLDARIQISTQYHQNFFTLQPFNPQVVPFLFLFGLFLPTQFLVNLDVVLEGARIWGFLTTRERKRNIHKHQTSWCEPQVREWYNDSHGCMTFTILKFDFKGWAKEQVFPSDDHLTIFPSDHVLRHGEPCLGVFGWFLATGKLGQILMNNSQQHLGILKSH